MISKAPAAAPAESRGKSHFLKAGDITLHCTEIGSGPTLVWLHGGGPGANALNMFRPAIDHFAERFRNLFVDLPQLGLSDKPPIVEPRFNYNATRVAAALTDLGVERANFIGNSIGGGIAAKIAIDFPERVDRLVLQGMGGLVRFGWTQGEMPDGIKLLMDIMMNGPTREKVAAFLRSLVYDESVVTEDLIEERFQASMDPEALDAIAKSGRPQLEDLEPDLGRIQAKTLLLYGREDDAASLDSAFAAVRGIPDARLIVVPRCGHWVQYERTSVFNRIVTEFLAGELD